MSSVAGCCGERRDGLLGARGVLGRGLQARRYPDHLLPEFLGSETEEARDHLAGAPAAPRPARAWPRAPRAQPEQPTRVKVESSHPIQRNSRNSRRPPQLGASGVPQRRLRAERARPGRAAPGPDVARAAASSPAGLESSVAATRPSLDHARRDSPRESGQCVRACRAAQLGVPVQPAAAHWQHIHDPPRRAGAGGRGWTRV